MSDETLKLGEALEDAVIEVLRDGLMLELESIELDKNDGVELPAPHLEAYYDYPIAPPFPSHPSVVVLADDAGSDENPDSAGAWLVKQRVFITFICADAKQSVLHDKCKRYILAALKTLLNSQSLRTSGYTVEAPWHIDYMPQKKNGLHFEEDVVLEITVDSLEG